MPEMSGREKAFDEWLEPFLEVLGHKARCRWAPIYLQGLFGGSERKSVQPMAAALTPDDYDQPQSLFVEVRR
jgi:SRSO17 transposase